MKKFLKNSLLAALSICLLGVFVWAYLHNCQRQEIRQKYEDEKKAMLNQENLHKSVVLAELKLASSLNSEKNLDVLPDSANVLTYYDRYAMLLGEWTLTEVNNLGEENANPSVYMDCQMVFDKKTQNYVLNIYEGSNNIVQSVVFNFRDMADLTDSEFIPDTSGELGNPLVLLKTKKIVIPQFSYFGMWKGDDNRFAILTNHYKHLVYWLVRPEPAYGG